MSGCVKLHRKITEWEWWDDHNATRLFIYIITKANHKDKKWRGVEIKRGQFLSSLDKLTKEPGISSQKIRTAIKRLKSTNEITSESTSQYTIYTVNKYDLYQYEQQENNTQNNKPPTNVQQTTNKQLTTTNNDKNIKKVKNVNISFDDFWDLYNYKVGKKGKVVSKWESLKDIERQDIMNYLPLYIQSRPDKQYRKHPMTFLNNEGWKDEIIITSNGSSVFKEDSCGFPMAYCDKCGKSASYKYEELNQDSKCCNGKLLPGNPVAVR